VGRTPSPLPPGRVAQAFRNPSLASQSRTWASDAVQGDRPTRGVNSYSAQDARPGARRWHPMGSMASAGHGPQLTAIAASAVTLMRSFVGLTDQHAFGQHFVSFVGIRREPGDIGQVLQSKCPRTERPGSRVLLLFRLDLIRHRSPGGFTRVLHLRSVAPAPTSWDKRSIRSRAPPGTRSSDTFARAWPCIATSTSFGLPS
jgi:hypothetical protein